MTCEVEQIADCGDISSLGRALFIPDKEDSNWLSQCVISLSSCGNLLAVAFKNRMCILSSQWISATDSNTFIISWSVTLSADVTALLAVPICPSNHSSQSGPDWFCIIVGLTNGNVAFYTNTGHLLFKEKFDDNPVMKISCHTGTFGTLADDIIVLYQTSECIIAGGSLFQTLRYAKAQMAKVEAGIQSNYSVDGRSINVRRWTFADQDLINDGTVAGLELKNIYDHLLAASTYGGYDTWYRSIPPQNSLILGAGSNPYLSFHYALEGGTSPPLQDVAKAVANRIKSALPGWLGGGTSESDQKAEPNTRSEALSMRSGIYDSQRHGSKVVLSPDKRLAAIVDNLGRVAVLDVSKGHIFRLFKGYRDGQCAFVQVFETDSKKPQLSVIKDIRRALFLVIYNPKKGLIDIRLMNKGIRVAVFTATKNGTLLYNTCGLVGAEPTYSSRKLNLPEYQCVLIDPDGKLKRFNIPFYFALEGEHSDRSKDLHILREMRDFIKKTSNRDSEFEEEILKWTTQIKTVDLMKHCLEMLVRNYEIKPKVIMGCLEIFWDKSSDVSEAQVIKCRNYFANLALATLFYRNINGDIVDDMVELINKINPPNNSDDTVDLPGDLNLLRSDNDILERLLNLAQEKDYKENQHARVHFADSDKSNYKLFVCSFDLEKDDNECLKLKTNLPQETFNDLSAHTFSSLFKMENYTDICKYITVSKLDPKDLLKLIITHIMNMSLDDLNIAIIKQLIGVIYCVCRVSSLATHVVYNESSDWWQSIRDMLVDMPCPLRSMIVAMACRVVVKLFEHNSEEEENWESVTKENAKWSILIGKLEDISILSIILYFKENFNGDVLPKLQATNLDINLKYIYSKGKGSVSELISKWLCSMGVVPEAVLVNEILERTEKSPDEDNYEFVFVDNHRYYVDNNPRLFKWFTLLRKQFPYSTSADNIIANMCWEYAVAWQKDVQKTELLSAVIQNLKNVQDVHLGLGLCIMIWATNIKQYFEATCRLVNKVGKLPKERLCLQDVGLTDKTMIKFLELAADYLSLFSTLEAKSIDAVKTKFFYEKIWDDTMPCLVELAQDMNVYNRDILNINYQISLSILFQCQFNLKVSKHLNKLYDVEMQHVFDGLTVNPDGKEELNYKALEVKLRDPRMKFINKVITASLELITCEEDQNDIGNIVTNKYRTGEANAWLEKTVELGDLWNIDMDFIKRQKVIGLFRLGYDVLVEEDIKLVKEPGLLMSPMLAVAMQRLKRHLETSAQPAEWIASVPPSLVHHLDNIETDPTIAVSTSISSTAAVIQNILCRIENSESSPVNKTMIRLAETVLKGCEIIIQENL